jgi:hypothetical protein
MNNKKTNVLFHINIIKIIISYLKYDQLVPFFIKSKIDNKLKFTYNGKCFNCDLLMIFFPNIIITFIHFFYMKEMSLFENFLINLKRVHISSYDESNLLQFCHNMEQLVIYDSRKMKTLDELKNCKKLQHLTLINCRYLHNIDAVKYFKNLRIFELR